MSIRVTNVSGSDPPTGCAALIKLDRERDGFITPFIKSELPLFYCRSFYLPLEHPVTVMSVYG